MLPTLIAGASVLILTALLMLYLSRNIVKVPLDAAAVLTGRKQFKTDEATGARTMVGYRVITGGSTFRIPIFERIDYLSLSEMAIEIDADDLRDVQGRLRSVSLLVNCRVSADPRLIERAIARFLTMRLEDVETIIRTTIESRLTNTLLTADLSHEARWQAVDSALNAAIRDDLEGLGVEVDTLIFRRIPAGTPPETAVNGQGRARLE